MVRGGRSLLVVIVGGSGSGGLPGIEGALTKGGAVCAGVDTPKAWLRLQGDAKATVLTDARPSCETKRSSVFQS